MNDLKALEIKENSDLFNWYCGVLSSIASDLRDDKSIIFIKILADKESSLHANVIG